MFCQKCGTKAIEGASFCQKCGAQLKKDEPIKSIPVEFPKPNAAPENTSPASKNRQTTDATENFMVQEAYDRLTVEAIIYPKLKRIKMRKSPMTAIAWLSVLGPLNVYTYSLNKTTEEPKISWSIRTGIELAHLAILICGIISFSGGY